MAPLQYYEVKWNRFVHTYTPLSSFLPFLQNWLKFSYVPGAEEEQ